MTEVWYNAVFEKDKSSNMSIPIHFYLYNLSYCYGIKRNDHMKFKLVQKFLRKENQLTHQGQNLLTRLMRHIDSNHVTLQNSVDGKDSLLKAHRLKLFKSVAGDLLKMKKRLKIITDDVERSIYE